MKIPNNDYAGFAQLSSQGPNISSEFLRVHTGARRCQPKGTNEGYFKDERPPWHDASFPYFCWLFPSHYSLGRRAVPKMDSVPPSPSSLDQFRPLLPVHAG